MIARLGVALGVFVTVLSTLRALAPPNTTGPDADQQLGAMVVASAGWALIAAVLYP